jgi:hypothetical protein
MRRRVFRLKSNNSIHKLAFQLKCGQLPKYFMSAAQILHDGPRGAERLVDVILTLKGREVELKPASFTWLRGSSSELYLHTRLAD